jgi:hypothetical protein
MDKDLLVFGVRVTMVGFGKRKMLSTRLFVYASNVSMI